MQSQLTPPLYISSPNTRLWSLADTGEAFVWSDSGQTAAMSGQMALLCESIYGQLGALPSLTSLLMVVDALTRENSVELVRSRVDVLMESLQHTVVDDGFDSVDPLVNWLHRLNRYSDDMRRGIEAQCAFFAEYLEGFPQRLLVGNAMEALDAIGWMKVAQADPDVLVEQQRLNDASQECEMAFAALEFMSQRSIDEQRLRNRLQTSLDDLTELEPDDTEPAPVNPYSHLLDAIKGDAELGTLAAMAAATASTISLPRRPSDPDHLPIGGVSDIVNRGHPESLLMTELAADSDLLMARIINHQALYLRRESPPNQKTQHRKLLVENSVRAWGMTRIRAAAFALAVAASEERRGDAQLEIYTVAGDSHWRDNLSTRDGLLAHLERLEPDPHPGAAIVDLLTAGDEEIHDDNPDLEYAEPLLVLSRSTFHDANFQRQVKDLRMPYLITTIDQDGQLCLIKRSRRGDETIHQQQMTWQEKTSLARIDQRTEEPAFVRKRIPPLRFSADLVAKWADSHEGPVFWKVWHDQRLLYFDKEKTGALEIMTLPSMHVLASETISSEEVRLVVEEKLGEQSNPRHVLIHASVHSDPIVHNIPTDIHPDYPDLSFAFDRGRLFCWRRNVSLHNADDGSVCASDFSDREAPILADGRDLGDGFFELHDGIYALYAEHNRLALHMIDNRHWSWNSTGLIANHLDGYPVAIASDLSWLRFLRGDETRKVQTPFKVISDKQPEFVTRTIDGNSIIVRYDRASEIKTPATSGFHLPDESTSEAVFQISLEHATVKRLPGDHLTRTHPEGAKLVSVRAVRNRFFGVATDGRSLFLQRNPSLFFQLKLEDNPRRLILRHTQDADSFLCTKQFSDECEPESENVRFKRQWKLRRADINSCKAWLDTRGLLHLRAGDGTELTLVLHDQHVSGWTPDGHVFGIRYFTNQDDDIPVPNDVVHWLREYAAECSE